MNTPHITLLELGSVDSTNTYAKDHFADLPDGTLVCAERQTAGRGRLGRRWVSPAGAGICASLVMKRITCPFYATMTASLAALGLLAGEFPQGGFFIKWPNDIYSGHRKVAGILCEAVSAAGSVSGIIAGVGININLGQAELDRIDQPAASLRSLSGRESDVKALTAVLARKLAEFYQLYLTAPGRLFAEWTAHNRIIGRTVTLADPAGTLHRVFVRGITPGGELDVEENGAAFRFNCGDVILSKEDLFG